MRKYKVLAINGTDKDFDEHKEALRHCVDLGEQTKAVYLNLDSKTLGALNTFYRGDGMNAQMAAGQRLLNASGKNYNTKVV